MSGHALPPDVACAPAGWRTAGPLPKWTRIGGALLTMASAVALGGTPRQPADIEGYAEARALAKQIDEQGAQALGAAMRALESGRIGFFGRDFILLAIGKSGLEDRFAAWVNVGLRDQSDAEADLREIGLLLEGQTRLPRKIPNPTGMQRLLLACLRLWEVGRPVELIEPLECHYALYHLPQPETVTLLARVVCSDPDPGRRVSACWEVIKAASPTAGPRGAERDEMNRIAVGALDRLTTGDADRVFGRSDLTFQHMLGLVARSRRALDVRLLALAALRRISPERAVAPAAKLAEEKWTDAKLDELARLLIEGDPTGVRLEVLSLLGAAGKTGEVRSRLEKKLRAEDLPKAERANVEFAIRLLSGGKPGKD